MIWIVAFVILLIVAPKVATTLLGGLIALAVIAGILWLVFKIVPILLGILLLCVVIALVVAGVKVVVNKFK